MKLSNITVEYRKQQGLTLDQLSEKSFLSKGFLSRLEKGDFDKKNVSLDTVIKLAKGFQVKVMEIFDLLNVTRDHQRPAPSLRAYLRTKYAIEDDSKIKIIEGLIDHLKK